MGFKISASDIKEIMDYLTKKCPGSNVDISIEPNESKLIIKASNLKSEFVTIHVHPESVSRFPELTKSVRLKDDV
jgi:hypothetical protein